MRDYKLETEERVKFIKELVKNAHASGIIYGNSGGKDSALVGILCKMACDNTLGIIMPCSSKRNFNEDMVDGKAVAQQFNIDTKVVDITDLKENVVKSISTVTAPTDVALANIAPRLRMTTLYAVGASENRLVAGTGNRSETYMGYFTKWGDGACDFNPISDLTVTEVYEFLKYLNAPESIIKKAPSAALFEGQTDEAEMGISYASIDKFLVTGEATPNEHQIMESYHRKSEHKRNMPITYKK